ncbi:MAG TPA: hypothetical protein VNP72_11200, partial [Longimicrobium sp.]|nr:hypothetical protein [Longimicrobium sp.]
GSDDGVVQLTRDGGRSWAEVTPPELRERRFARISLVEASPHRPGTAYVAANRYQQDDRAPYAYRTDDYGATWTRITGGIPADDFFRAVREDPARPRLLYAGTEHGAWFSLDDGARWQPLRLNLPDTQVPDLVVKDNDVVIATHGRGFYVLDDVAPLRQLTPAARGADVHLFDPSDVVRAVDPGVAVYYTLRQPARSVTLDFLDAQGRVIRTFTGTPADSARRDPAAGGGGDDEEGPARPAQPKPSVKAGMNRFVWDLRHAGPVEFPGIILWAAQLRGPRGVPGAYRVRLTVDGRPAQTQDFRVLADPRLPGVTPAELEAQFALASRVVERTSAANQAVLRIRGMREQVNERLGRTRDAGVRAAADSLLAALSAVENELYQTRLQSNQDPLNYPIRLNNKLAALLGVIESAESAPTRQTYEVFDELSRRLDAQLAALEGIVAGGLARFNTLLRARRLRPIDPNAMPTPPTEEQRRATAEAAGELKERQW